MRRLDLTMALAGLVVVAVGVGGSFLFGVEEGLEPDNALPGSLVEENVSIASLNDALPATGVATGGTTRVEMPFEVSVTDLKDLAFRVEVRTPTAFVGTLEWHACAVDPAGTPVACGEAVRNAGVSEWAVGLAGTNLTDAPATWTVVLEGTVQGQAAEDFPVTLDVTGTALRPPRAG